MKTVLNEALKLVRSGIPVTPLEPGGKIPIDKKFYKNCLRTEDAVRARWAGDLSKGVGIVTKQDDEDGPGTFFIGVDYEPTEGSIEEQLSVFPRTWTVKTRKGFHLYFKRPAREINGGAIIVGSNGKAWNQQTAVLYVTRRQFVAPPTVVSWEEKGGERIELSPHEYRWYEDLGGLRAPWECELAELPEWCYEQTATKDAVTATTALVRTAHGGKYPPDHRHAMLLRTVRAMRSKGMNEVELRERLLERSVKDCSPPKAMPEIIKEVDGLVKWAMEKVVVSKSKFQDEQANANNEGEREYVNCLGFKDDEYFYTSSSNQQVVQIRDANHGALKLCTLMPKRYWIKKGYTNENGTVLWTDVASDLMEECRNAGIFDERKTRGIGCWSDEGRLVLHLGDRLLVDGKEYPNNDFTSEFIYSLGTSLNLPHAHPLTVEETKPILDLCNGLDWTNPGMGILLAGAAAIFRISGALPWRPHFWITSPRGSGKSTVARDFMRVIGGRYSEMILGGSSSAGIRQDLRLDSRPVIFDESETVDAKTDAGMQAIIELIRQASSENDGRIVKGTADGRGHSFKVNASFFLASINVNLRHEADKSRFTVLELKRGDEEAWRERIAALYSPITRELGERLFARTLKLWPVINKNRVLFEDLVSRKSDRRTGQQYGVILAGYASLICDGELAREAAQAMMQALPQFSGGKKPEIEEADERLCLDWLLASFIEIEESGIRRRITIGEAITEAQGSEARQVQLQRYGIDVWKGDLLVRSSAPQLEKIFNDTKWIKGWAGSLSRLEGGVVSHRHRFLGQLLRCVKLPISSVFTASK